MFKPHEISFVINEHNTTMASLVYDNIPHSHKAPFHIDKNTKLVIFYCNNHTRIKVFNKAKALGIFDKIIQVQPQAHENKMIQHSLLNGKIDIPETKIFLDSGDDISDYLVKPYNGFYGNGIEHATSPFVYNKFFQKHIDKVREFRIVYCSWFDNDSQSMVIEKEMDDPTELTQNYFNGSTFEPVVFDNFHKSNVDQSIVDRLRIYGKFLCKELHLDYVGADFILDKNDKLQFLECNWMSNHEALPNIKECDDQHVRLFANLIKMDKEVLYKKLYKNFT